MVLFLESSLLLLISQLPETIFCTISVSSSTQKWRRWFSNLEKCNFRNFRTSVTMILVS